MPGRPRFDETYAADLRALVTHRGMTIKDAAAELGMSYATARRLLA